MGSSLNSCNIAVIMMRDLFVLCLVPLAVLSTPMPYKDDGYDKDTYGSDGDSYTKDDGYGKKLVCKPVYDTIKEKSVCINVHNPYCKHEEKTIIDRTCRTSTKFDCPTEYGYGKDDYGKDSYGKDDYGDDYGKDYKKPECHKSSSTSCYDTPRTVIVPKCSTTSEKVCETVPQRYPDVSERQHCHNEDKKVCQLEERTQPKQVKKYVYTKQ